MTGTATCTKNLTVPIPESTLGVIPTYSLTRNKVDSYSELGRGYSIPAYSID